MTRHHNINGVQVPFTAEEEAQRDAEEQAWLMVLLIELWQI
jgi:hypothetical protein